MKSNRHLIYRQFVRRLRNLRQRFSSEWRVARSAEWQQQPALLQPWPVTRRNRHPEFFELARQHLSKKENVRIMSFGCATGEEVFTIADYLPGASIDGFDINPNCIAKARRRTPTKLRAKLTFECRDNVAGINTQYDAIFCLSVLRHGRLAAERPQSCANILPFAKFAEATVEFDRLLKPGGLLFIWAANYRFVDLPLRARYRSIAVPAKRKQPGPFYGQDDRLLGVSHESQWVFEKLS